MKIECVFTLRDLPIYRRQAGEGQRGGGGRVREGPGAVIVHYMQLIYI